MNERLAKAEALFHNALELPPGQRDAFLQQACAEDPQLRREVTALLRASGIADDWLKDDQEPCSPRREEGGFPSPINEAPGTVIGRYKLLEHIGEGGFGVVYMAEQQEPVRRRVALKIIKLGMDTRSVIARFEAERQALAMMDHPNIAKVLDAGATDTGRPYFVMELVRGIPITKFCEENRLSTKQRLELFIQVCGAIQHAHQKGIIHRDIKPTNVLVTMNDGVPHPMVIDFGVAKAINQRLTEKTLFTNFAQMIGTPAYMSPEQAEMSKLDVDTRSDVYSLGVLLYELLTGTTPFPEERLRNAGYAEMQRIICEEEPPKPSTRRTRNMVAAEVTRLTSKSKSKIQNPKSEIDRDLDCVVMKCLEKDRTRRYDTASALVLDIQRHLNNEPILAVPASRIYRFDKLVHRNKLAFAAAAAVAAALLLGSALSTWLFLRERTALKVAGANALRAEQQANRAEQNAYESRRNLYAADMLLTQAALEADNISRARELLLKYVPRPGDKDLRHWEWRYAWDQCRSDELFTLPQSHRFTARTLVFSADGAILASGGDAISNSVVVWDVKNRTAIRAWAPNTDPTKPFYDKIVFGLAFSKDDKELLVGTLGGQVSLWNCDTWQLVTTLTNLSGLRSLAVSSDKRFLAVLCYDFLILWNLADRLELARFEVRRTDDWVVGGLAFSPDSSLLAYNRGDGPIMLMDVATLKSVGALRGHERYVSTLAFSPTGSILVSGSRDRTVRVWDVTSRTELRQLGSFSSWVAAVSFSPDGAILAVAGSGQIIRLFETQLWKEINVLKGRSEALRTVAFAPDGQTMMTSSTDQAIKGWAISTNQQAVSRPLPSGMKEFSLSQNGKFLHVMHTNRSYTVWPTHPSEQVATYSVPLSRSRPYAVSPDGRLWASATTNRLVKVFDQLRGQSIAELPAGSASISSLTFSYNGQMLAGLGNDHTCRVWRLSGGKDATPLASEIAAFVTSIGPAAELLRFSRNDRLIAIFYHGVTEVWNIAAQRRLAILPREEYEVREIVISRDDRTLLMASTSGRVKMWDLTTVREVATLSGELNNCFSVALSSDESRIAACGGDGTVRLWDMETKRQVASLKLHKYPLRQLAFTPEDSLIVLDPNLHGDGHLFTLRAPKVADGSFGQTLQKGLGE